jgi:amino acid adenylation domain-containing protein
MSALLTEFLAQAERTPHAPALVVGEQQLSYYELAHASAVLASRLMVAGAVPGSVVCIRLPQSAESFVAILATLRAGCTWAVVEPTQPEGRLAALLADTHCTAIIHSGADSAELRSLLGSLPGASNRRQPALLAVADPAASVDPVAPVPVPEGLPAYLIYTSGSTGRPKGVLVTREQLAASVLCREWIYGPEPPVFLDTLRFSFDGSLAAAFWTVTRGGTLVVPAEEQLRDPAAIAELASRHYASHLIGVPSFYRLLLQHAGRLPIELRLAALGGEPCTAELVTLHRSRLPAVTLVNEYGPTETVVSCTAHRIHEVPVGNAPIGRPHPGAVVRVLDEKLRIQPVGAVGELYVGGAFPALGYANQPARTAERFVADPYADRPGARLYRTGDLVSWNADGELEFHGRADDQLKVRGHRIELGEVVRVLQQRPEVISAEVLPVTEGEDIELVAFVETSHGRTPDPAELRRHCLTQLPDAAVPIRFEAVQVWPRNRNGKVDREALAQRLTRQPASPTTPSAIGAAGEVEAALQTMWSEVLGHDRAGDEDNFFEQGGTSLKLIDLHNRMERRWPGVLRVGELFDLTTVKAQARTVRERTGQTATAAPVRRQAATSYEL